MQEAACDPVPEFRQTASDKPYGTYHLTVLESTRLLHMLEHIPPILFTDTEIVPEVQSKAPAVGFAVPHCPYRSLVQGKVIVVGKEHIVGTEGNGKLLLKKLTVDIDIQCAHSAELVKL